MGQSNVVKSHLHSSCLVRGCEDSVKKELLYCQVVDYCLKQVLQVLETVQPQPMLWGNCNWDPEKSL